MAIKDITLNPVPIPPSIPEEGFYIDIEYMYGDADGDAVRTVGPFPIAQKRLLLQLLNVLDQMASLYPRGKGGYDGYESIPYYDEWFDEDERGDSEDDDFRDKIDLKTEYVPDGSGCIAKLVNFEVYYRDGRSLNHYEVNLVET